MISQNLNPEINGTLLRKEKIEYRQYQKSIAERCINKNSLIVIPTGLGKTIIAVLVAAWTLEKYPKDSKVVILAPTRPLIEQHYHVFVNFIAIPEERFVLLTGKINSEKRKNLFLEKQFFFYTPQTLRNDLTNNKYSLKKTCLIIFDEAHHAFGDYAYNLIADIYIEQNPDGNILGLTASPGSSKEKIHQLCENLHIPFKNTHFRTRKDQDVREYIKSMDIFKIGVDLTELMEEIYKALKILLEERLQYLSQFGFLDTKSDELFKKIIRKDLLRLNSELLRLKDIEADKTGIYSALSVNAQALILFHMIELVEQQGLDNLLYYLESELYKKAQKKTTSKAVKILASDRRLYSIYSELKRNQEASIENLIHPKYKVLEKLLLDEISQNQMSKILIFAKFRISVKNIVQKLKKNNILKPIRFVGQSSKSKDDKGLSQKEQIKILEQFKEGGYNILVCTNVAEEGLDIAECDLVIFYDVVASEIRYIQRKGRTARHREGKVVILYTKKTNDEIYLNIVFKKLKQMNVNLKSSNYLNNSNNRKELNLKPFEKKVKEDINRINQEGKIVKSIIRQDKTEINFKSITKTDKKDISTLDFFLNENIQNRTQRTQQPKKKNKQYDIILSKFIPMKIGLRKTFSKENIPFKITNSELHIILFNEVIIQIFNPKVISKTSLIEFQMKVPSSIKLAIAIFDFIEFKEDFEGEKRLLKKKLKEYETSLMFKIICIDNYEEFHFIIKNIYEQIKTRD